MHFTNKYHLIIIQHNIKQIIFQGGGRGTRDASHHSFALPLGEPPPREKYEEITETNIIFYG